MAQKVITPEEYQAIKNASKKPLSEFLGKTVKYAGDIIKKTHSSVMSSTPGIIDSLTRMIVAIIYFTFSGLAILLKKPMPKEWIAISRDFRRHTLRKVAPRLSEVATAPLVKSSVKIVDLETKEPIKLSE